MVNKDEYIFAGCSVVNDSEVSFPVYHMSQLHYRARDDASLIVRCRGVGDRLQQQQQRTLHLPFEWSRIDIMRMSPMLWAERNSFCVPPARPTSLNAHLVADCVRGLGGRTLCDCVRPPPPSVSVQCDMFLSSASCHANPQCKAE